MNKKTLLFAMATPLLIMGAGCGTQNSDIQKNSSGKTPSSAAFGTDQNGIPAVSKTDSVLTYTNETYGFSFELPSAWAVYTTKNRTLDWGTLGTSDSIDFGFSVQDSLFNVSIFSKSQWQKLKSAEGPAPMYVGENSLYVFGYATAQFAQDDTIVERMKEIKDIIKTFKIIPIVL